MTDNDADLEIFIHVFAPVEEIQGVMNGSRISENNQSNQPAAN